ncbi:hypothetical protein DPEC_G00269180 [Dallia pectoralis]|uniref:Uncharacterized protein n=1 Tax=Dallia pectoralis TaxID=75939 RepID=A0ACC2FP26_DALPE|nr:hypothetical protein DPEC_G00269180 [Dallia pectoralis]
MKLWKCVAIALTLIGAALSLFLTKITVPASPEASSTQTPGSSNSSSNLVVHQRKVRSTDGVSDIFTEFIHMFQSFTEGELKEMIGILLEKKARREAMQSKRTKRAKKRPKTLCSLRRVEVTISELGLGYESDETLLFNYCIGRCLESRHNYDLILKQWTKKDISKRAKGPCCRPTTFDNISFLDNNNKYMSLGNFSAVGCQCV